MDPSKQMDENIGLFNDMPRDVISLQINGSVVGDKWKKILIYLNENKN